MQTISFKLDDSIVKEVDSLLKPMRYSNRTEFIREAVREKLEREDMERRLQLLEKLRGSLKGTLSAKQYEKNREEAIRELIKENGWKLD